MMSRAGRSGLLVLLLVALLVALAAPAASQSDKERIGWLIADKATVNNSLAVTGTSEFTGAATFAGAITPSGGIDLNGSALTIDADADTILDESADDVVGLTMGAAAGTFSVLTGNMKVGNGTPTQTQDGEDSYVEGLLEVDSVAHLDGGAIFNTADLNGTALTIDADADTILDESADDVVGLTMGAASGTFSVLTGNAKVGNGTPTQTQDGEDSYVEGLLEVDSVAHLDGGAIFNTADLNGTALTIDADADTILDESADDVVGLTLGAAGGTFSVLTGNMKVGNGTPTVTQTGEDLYVNGILEVDAITYLDGNTYLGGTQNYLSTNTLYLDSDSDITMVGSANNLALTTVAAGTVSVTTGNLKVGNGSPTIAQDGEDSYVEGQFEVDGEAQFDGALDANSTADFASTVAIGGDVTLTADATGGNAGAKTEFIGLPRIKLAGVGVKDGTALVQVDDSPAAEWTGTANVTDTADTAVYKVGANSLKLEFAAGAVATNGASNPGPTGDWTGFKSIGFWVYADKAFTAAQLDIYLTDVTDPATFNTCEYTVANVWQYCEVDISSLATTVGDDVTDISIRMAAGLPVAINIYIDNMVVWAAADEVSLGVALQQDGDLGFVNALTGAQLDPSADYTIAWRSGVDYAVVVADLDPDGMFGMVAY